MPGFEIKNGTSRHLTPVRSPPRNSTRGPRETCPPDQLRAGSRCPAPRQRARAAPRPSVRGAAAAPPGGRAAAPHTWHSCTGAHLAAHLRLRCGAGRHTPCLQTAGGKQTLCIHMITSYSIAGFIFSLALPQPQSPLPLADSLVLVILTFAKNIPRCSSKAVTARRRFALC